MSYGTYITRIAKEDVNESMIVVLLWKKYVRAAKNCEKLTKNFGIALNGGRKGKRIHVSIQSPF